MNQAWSSGNVMVWTVLASLSLVLLSLPGIIFRISGAVPVIAWVIALAFGVYIALVQAEIRRFPSIDVMAKQALGRLVGFLAGWLWWWFSSLAVVILVLTLSRYLSNELVLQQVWSVFFILVAGCYLYYKSPGMNKIVFWVNLLGLCGLGLLVLASFGTFSFTKISAEYEFDGVLIAVWYGLIVSVSSILAGFLAQRIEQPESASRVAVFGAVYIAGIVFLSVFVLGASHPLEMLKADSYILDIAYGMTHSWVIPLLLIFIVGLVAVLIWFVVGVETVFNLAQESLLFRRLAVLHPQYKTMAPAIEFQSLVCIGLVMLSAPHQLYTLFGIAASLVTFLIGIILVSYIVLKVQDRMFAQQHGLAVMVAIAALIGVGYLEWVVMNTTPFGLYAARVATSILALGVPAFILMELYYNNRAVRKASDIVAYLALWFENLILPRKLRLIALEYLGDIKNQRVLELGCSVGTLTLDLAKQAGRVYATDISEKDLLIARRRMIRNGFYNVRMIHDPNHTKQVHPKIPRVDAIVSVGMLGYFADPYVVLKVLNQKVARGDPVVFIDYDKFFDMIPNQDWLRHNHAIMRTFRRAGFLVKVEHRQGFAWRYIIIHGKKVASV